MFFESGVEINPEHIANVMFCLEKNTSWATFRPIHHHHNYCYYYYYHYRYHNNSNDLPPFFHHYSLLVTRPIFYHVSVNMSIKNAVALLVVLK